MKNEIWKDIYGYKGIYRISNFGRVRTFYNRVNLLKPNFNKKYAYVTLVKNKRKSTFHIHRLVAKAFCNKYRKGKEVNHIDNNRFNNCFKNLEWLTPKQNKERHLKFTLKGEDMFQSKLTEKEVLKIRKEYSKQKTSHRKLAKKYDVSKNTIASLLNGTTWKHV